MNYFIIVLIIILVVIYLFGSFFKEKFVSGYGFGNGNGNGHVSENIKSQIYEPVNYNTKNQNCNELTYDPEVCMVETVRPKNIVVCNKSLSPITNNDILNNNCTRNKKKLKKNQIKNLRADTNLDLSNKSQNQSLNSELLSNKSQNKSLNSELLSDFDNLQQKNTIQKIENFDDLKTDVKSLNSLENDLDLVSNY